MAGVLIALALNAWWHGRQDHAQETAYLRQLTSDLDATETLLANADTTLAPFTS